MASQTSVILYWAILTLSATAATGTTTISTGKHPAPAKTTTYEGMEWKGYKIDSVPSLYEYITDRVKIDFVSDEKIQLWATVHVPADFERSTSTYPLLLFLHGRHDRCEEGKPFDGDISTDHPECTVYQRREVQSHRGYEYMSSELVRKGYVVVSINSNSLPKTRYYDDDITMRARLALKHLHVMTLFNKSNETILPISLKDRIDFSRTGLMGHSRGGLAMREAYNLLMGSKAKKFSQPWLFSLSQEVRISALLEIGPVDMRSRAIDAIGIHWLCLLPLCDGDVIGLDGMHTFDRMTANGNVASDGKTKSVWHVFGANHNFFNTRWPENDAQHGCHLQKPVLENASFRNQTKRGYVVDGRQRQIAIKASQLIYDAFVSETMSAEGANFLLDPVNKLPAELTNITAIARNFAPTSGTAGFLILDDFTEGNVSESNCKIGEGLRRCLISDEASTQIAASTWNDELGHRSLKAVAVAPTRNAPGKALLRVLKVDLSNEISNSRIFDARVSVGIRNDVNVAAIDWDVQQIKQQERPSQLGLQVQLVDCNGKLVGIRIDAGEFMIIRPTPVRKRRGVTAAHELLQSLRIPMETLLNGTQTMIKKDGCGVAGVAFEIDLPDGHYEFNFAMLRFQKK